MDQMVEKLFIEVLNMSLTGSLVILAVILARLCLRKAPRIFSYVLWAAVLFRLLCPVSFAAGFSLLGLLQNEAVSGGRMEYIPENIGYQMEPSVKLPVPAGNEVVNASLPAGNPEGSVNAMQIILYVGARLWILGSLAFVLYGAVSLARLMKRLRRTKHEKGNIYRMEGRGTPFVCGLFRPRIYLPEGLLAEEERCILLHEEIHIRRGDHIFRLLAYLALCLHWFNPLVWLAFSLSGRDMEMACDEAVIRKMGNRAKKEYSASLLSMASGSRIVKGIPLAFGEGDIKSRIQNVLRYKKPARLLMGAAGAVCVLLIVFLIANPGEQEKEEETVYYGVVSREDAEWNYRMVVRIPGLGDMEIPEAETVEYLIESASVNSDGLLYEGDLVKITFPAGEEVMIRETWPGSFSVPAERISVYGEGFVLRQAENGRWYVTIPIGWAREAGEGDTLEIYRDNGQEGELLASSAVLAVDEEKHHIWVELSKEEAWAYLAEFGRNLTYRIAAPKTAAKEEAAENSQAGGVKESRRIHIKSISGSGMGIDSYIAGGEDENEGTAFLAFAENCVFMVNTSMEKAGVYEEVSFDEFAGIAEAGMTYLNVPCSLTMEGDLITAAYLDSSWYSGGITYTAFSKDTWYEDIQEINEMSGEEVLESFYTLVRTEQADIGDGPGEEGIEIYTGNIGDGDSGIVLFKDEKGQILYAESAHHARSGWNNIYLGEAEGVPYLLKLHIENRDTYGEYGYQVFRLGEGGEILQIAGTCFEFGDGRVPYEEEAFKAWAGNLTYYLEHSHLLLSSQEGEIRTEPVSEADKYSYETLRRGN